MIKLMQWEGVRADAQWREEGVRADAVRQRCGDGVRFNKLCCGVRRVYKLRRCGQGVQVDAVQRQRGDGIQADARRRWEDVQADTA